MGAGEFETPRAAAKMVAMMRDLNMLFPLSLVRSGDHEDRNLTRAGSDQRKRRGAGPVSFEPARRGAGAIWFGARFSLSAQPHRGEFQPGFNGRGLRKIPAGSRHESAQLRRRARALAALDVRFGAEGLVRTARGAGIARAVCGMCR